jgi:hypothetical protein
VSYALAPSSAFKRVLAGLDLEVQEAVLDLLDLLAEHAEDASAGMLASSVNAGVTAHMIRVSGDAEFFGALLEHTDDATQTIQVLRLIALSG